MTTPSDMLKNFDDLPAMPNVMMRALNVIQDPIAGASSLAKIISYDQSLSTKVLTLVNSAYYGFAQQITSIARAISLIGMSKTKNIIMTVAMRPMLTSQGDKLLWQHSIVTAVGCEYLAKHLKIMDVDDAFVVGFLHDLGKLVLSIKNPRIYEQVKRNVALGKDVIEVEQNFFGVDHCTMGSLLSKQWGLPLLISNTIKYHHRPQLSSIPVPCALVSLVDTLIKDNFTEGKLDKNVLQILNFVIDDPKGLRENIFAKANILLKELSS